MADEFEQHTEQQHEQHDQSSEGNSEVHPESQVEATPEGESHDDKVNEVSHSETTTVHFEDSPEGDGAIDLVKLRDGVDYLFAKLAEHGIR